MAGHLVAGAINAKAVMAIEAAQGRREALDHVLRFFPEMSGVVVPRPFGLCHDVTQFGVTHCGLLSVTQTMQGQRRESHLGGRLVVDLCGAGERIDRLVVIIDAILRDAQGFEPAAVLAEQENEVFAFF